MLELPGPLFVITTLSVCLGSPMRMSANDAGLGIDRFDCTPAQLSPTCCGGHDVMAPNMTVIVPEIGPGPCGTHSMPSSSGLPGARVWGPVTTPLTNLKLGSLSDRLAIASMFPPVFVIVALLGLLV